MEDSPADIELTRQALAQAKVVNRLHVVRDAESALRFVRGEGAYASVPRPDLVLLDLNLPHAGGLHVLAEIKHDRRLCAIPVVVLTTSADEHDIARAYREHANANIRKPVRLADFIAVVHSIGAYWLGTVELPGDVD